VDVRGLSTRCGSWKSFAVTASELYRKLTATSYQLSAVIIYLANPSSQVTV
jgi:hypothetical protein